MIRSVNQGTWTIGAAAVGLASLTASAGESLLALAAGWEHAPGYFALCAGLALTAALGLGLLLGRWPSLALAVWAAGVASLAASPALGVAMGLATLAVSMPLQARVSTLNQGLWVAAGVCWALLAAPRLLARLLPGLAPPFSDLVAPSVILVAVLIASAGGLWLLQRIGAPGLAAPALLGVALLPGALPWLSQRSHPDRAAPSFAAAEKPASQPDVLLLILDTVGADHLSLYGYGRPTTPQLEAFLQRHPRAAVFPNAFANSNWTVPSHASLLSGLLPSEHTAHFGAGTQTDFRLRAPATLAEELQDAGYQTVAIFGNPWFERVQGMRRGFDVYFKPRHPDHLPLLGEKLRRWLVPGIYPEAYDSVPQAPLINAQIMRYFEACSGSPCFLLANYIDGHTHYVPPPACRGRFGPWSVRQQFHGHSVHDSAQELARMEARYDEELCGLDLEITELLERFEAEGKLERSWVFITSDHGEAFGDHGVTEHGTSVYNEQVRIPLIVIPPAGRKLSASPAAVSLIDVTATISAISTGKILGTGRDLRQLDAANRAAIEFFGDEAKAARHGALAQEPARAIVVGNHKLIEHAGRTELYELSDDPHERENLAEAQPTIRTHLEAVLPPLSPTPRAEGLERPLSAEELELLRELGYVE